MDKFLFLDIDGVIATPDTVMDGLWALSDIRQDRLGLILERTGAQIVLSSSWRKPTVELTRDKMDSEGFRFSDRIVGVTIRSYNYITGGIHMSMPRGVEIKQWIDTHIHSDNGKNWQRKELGVDYNYLILDDDGDMLLEHRDHFIQCDSALGQTDDDVTRAIELLNLDNGI